MSNAPKLPPLPPDIKAMIENAKESDHDEKVRGAFLGSLEQSVNAALGLAVVAYAEAKTKLERERAVRTASVVICTLHTIQIVIDGALPPVARGPVQELFVRAASGEVLRHDEMLRKTLPNAEELRRKYLADVAAAEFFCHACERPYAPGELQGPKCITPECESDVVSASEVRQ